MIRVTRGGARGGPPCRSGMRTTFPTPGTEPARCSCPRAFLPPLLPFQRWPGTGPERGAPAIRSQSGTCGPARADSRLVAAASSLPVRHADARPSNVYVGTPVACKPI